MIISTISGNVGRDASLKDYNSRPYISFPVACDVGRGVTQWCDVTIWGKRAEALHPHITKGTKVTAVGRLKVRVSDKGTAYLDVDASEIALQGGGQSQSQPKPQESAYDGYQQSDSQQQPNAPQGGSQDFGGGSAGFSDLDDEIPFAPEWRA